MYPDWNALERACESCAQCGLSENRTKPVFGVGNPQAEVLLIGEAPGEQEDLRGEPFVGRSGHLLDQYRAEIDLYRSQNIYIANMVKCRPPGNRDPQPQEQELCLPWLREQIRLMRPKMIVCLGRISAQKLIASDYKVTRQHGQFVEKAGIRFMGTFHPAALLRDPRRKPEALADFIALREKIRECCERTYTKTE